MRVKNKNEKKKLVFLICMLLTLVLGIGHAVLSQQLKIDGSVNYGTMAWDVGFTEAYDGGGSISSSPTVSEDKKSISITCNVGTSTSSETCIAQAKVKNSSTFAVELESDPTITYDSTYISSITSVWSENSANIVAGDSLSANDEKEVKITITTKQLTEDLLPEASLSVPVSITLDWVEIGSSATNNVLSNKSVLFIGDSVQYGQGNGGKGWSYYIDEEYEMAEVKKVAVSGSSFTKNSTGTDRIINQFKNLTGTYDYVILEGGINDLTYGSTWGTLNDSIDIKNNSTIIVEAIEETIHTLLTKYPDSNIGYILLYNTEDSGRNGHDTMLDEYHNLLLSIFDKWNIPVFDMYSESVFYENERVTFDDLLDVHNTTYLTDGLHLNDAGYQLTYKYIGEWMKTLKPVSYPVIDGEENEEDVTEPEVNKENVTIGTDTFIAVDDISGLIWTKDKMVNQTGQYADTTSTGRVASVGYLLKVNGGETISISDGSNYNFAIYEINASGSSTGAIANAWISDSLTLNTNTRYVKVYMKKINAVEWTDSEISNIVNILSLTSSTIVEPDYEEDEEEVEVTNSVVFKGVTYNTTNLISGLEWTKGYQLSQQSLNYDAATGKTGRVASVGYLLKVDGGETITITDGNTYNFAIYEVNNSGSSTGAIANSWITSSITLNTNTRYVGIYLKRVDEVDWTNEEIENIPNILKIQ